MKKVIFILTVMFTMAVSANAEGINGKWKCSKEFLDGLGLHYPDMHGHYKFKKDGTFKVKINGIQRTSAKFTLTGYGYQKPKNYHAMHRRIYIKVSGIYKIVNDSTQPLCNQKTFTAMLNLAESSQTRQILVTTNIL